MKRNLKELEHRIGYTFQDFALLKKAMSHSSYVNEEHLPKYECNERLNSWVMQYWNLCPVNFYFLNIRQLRKEN